MHPSPKTIGAAALAAEALEGDEPERHHGVVRCRSFAASDWVFAHARLPARRCGMMGRGGLGALDEQVSPEVGRRPASPLHGLGWRRGRTVDRYSRRVALLKRVLPAIGLTLLLLVAAWPRLVPLWESVRLSLPTIDLREARELKMLNPRYAGLDREGRPFVLTAEVGRQVPDRNDLMSLDRPEADLTLRPGTVVALSSATALYQTQAQLLDLFDDVVMVHSNGTRFVTRRAHADLAANIADGHDPVKGHGPSGDIAAQGFRIADKGESIVFIGPAQLRAEGGATPPCCAPAADCASRGGACRGCGRGGGAGIAGSGRRAAAGRQAATAGDAAASGQRAAYGSGAPDGQTPCSQGEAPCRLKRQMGSSGDVRSRRCGPLSVRLAELLALCLAASLPAGAQGLNLGNIPDDKPVEISANSGIEWRQDAQVYIARGNAVAKRGANEVHADVLTAHYRPSKTKNPDGGSRNLPARRRWACRHQGRDPECHRRPGRLRRRPADCGRHRQGAEADDVDRHGDGARQPRMVRSAADRSRPRRRRGGEGGQAHPRRRPDRPSDEGKSGFRRRQTAGQGGGKAIGG